MSDFKAREKELIKTFNEEEVMMKIKSKTVKWDTTGDFWQPTGIKSGRWYKWDISVKKKIVRWRPVTLTVPLSVTGYEQMKLALQFKKDCQKQQQGTGNKGVLNQPYSNVFLTSSLSLPLYPWPLKKNLRCWPKIAQRETLNGVTT